MCPEYACLLLLGKLSLLQPWSSQLFQHSWILSPLCCLKGWGLFASNNQLVAPSKLLEEFGYSGSLRTLKGPCLKIEHFQLAGAEMAAQHGVHRQWV